jgi:hypothetical protein
MNARIATILLSVTVLVSSIGCNKNEADRPAREPSAVSDPMPATGTNATVSGTAASAGESIAEARCAREQVCGNTGDNKKYSSQQDCLARIRADWKDDLNARECPNGVNQTQLNECLKAIRDEDCGNPFDTLGRVAACTKSQICNG